MKKRILSVLLALSMALTLLPGAAFAAGEDVPPTEKPAINADTELYQVEVMCEEEPAHYWSYPSAHGWNTTADQFTVGEIRANDLDNGTAEQYPYICPVTPADTMEYYLAEVNAKAEGHRAVTAQADYPVAYYYWNSTDGWTLLRDKQPDINVTFNQGNEKHEGTLHVYVTCAEAPDPGTGTEPEEGKPAAKPTVQEADLYQVEIVCRDKGESGKDTHWWSAVSENGWSQWVNDFTVGEIEENTGYRPETYPWRCPVTPKGSLNDYLGKLSTKTGEPHKLVTANLPVAYYYYSAADASWTFIKDQAANPNCTVSADGKNTWYLSIEATCAEVEEPGGTQWLTSLNVPGYDLFMKDPSALPATAGGKHLILAQSGAEGDTDVYALYLNPDKACQPNNGVIKGQGVVTARLGLENGELVGYLLGEEPVRLTLDQLLMTVTATEGGYQISNGGRYLNMGAAMVGDPFDLAVTARAETGGAYKLIGASNRVLTLFIWGQNSTNDKWMSNFWGPVADNGQFSINGSAYIYFLHEHIDDGKTVAAYDATGGEIAAIDGAFTIPTGGYIEVEGEKTFTVPDFVRNVTLPQNRASMLKMNSDGGFGVMGCEITMLDGSTTTGIDRSGQAGGKVSFARTADNRLYFAGEGGMENYSSKNTSTPPWLNGVADRTLRSVSIGAGVTSVGSNAFKGTSLTSVTLGEGVETIGDSAFESTRIGSIEIPNTVTDIGVNAFKGCLELRSVTLPESVISIGSNAFANCTRLRSVTVAGTLGAIPNGAFQSMSGHSRMNLVIQGAAPAAAYHDYEGMLPFLHQNGAIVYTQDTPGESLVKSGGSDAYFAVTGGVDLSGIELRCGELPTLPARDNVPFSGWQIGATNAAVPGDTAVSGQPAGTVFTARWGGEYAVACTVTIDGVGYTVAQGQTMGEQMPADPTREGYRFAGWVDGSGAAFTADTPISGNTMVTSTWTAIPVFTVTFNANGGVLGGQGSITVYEGEELTLSQIPNVARKGYTLDGWFTADGQRFLGAAITADVTLTAQWSEQGSDPAVPPEEGPVVVRPRPDKNPENHVDPLPFVDVAPDAWYASAVAYVYSENLMRGTSALTFEPAGILNRGMMAQLLYNLAGEPEITAWPAFTDLRPGAYYTDAVAWCAANSVINGYSDGIFGGEDVLTREQMVVMLHRYAKGRDKAGPVDLTVLNAFADAGGVSGWAAESMAWAVEGGLLKGRGDSLAPLAEISRAEAAAILERCAKLLHA